MAKGAACPKNESFFDLEIDRIFSPEIQTQGDLAQIPDQIQHFVLKDGFKSTFRREQILNPQESAIRFRFVPESFSTTF
jgi:hypothetical protein